MKIHQGNHEALDEFTQVPQLVKSTDPSTMVGVAQIQEAIEDWECGRLRGLIRRNFESPLSGDLLNSVPTASRVMMHPRAERGEGQYLKMTSTLEK